MAVIKAFECIRPDEKKNNIIGRKSGGTSL